MQRRVRQVDVEAQMLRHAAEGAVGQRNIERQFARTAQRAMFDAEIVDGQDFAGPGRA